MADKIKVMIVDDSAVVRTTLSEILASEPSIEVIATAQDPIFARQKMERDWPDVIILDIEMPRMDGLTFLDQLMQERPTPVVICSSLTQNGASVSMEALARGAVQAIAKPEHGLKEFLEDYRSQLVRAVKSAAHTNLSRDRHVRALRPVRKDDGEPVLEPAPSTAPGRENVSPSAAFVVSDPSARIVPPPSRKTGASAELIAFHGPAPRTPPEETLIAIGASAGGTVALEALLTAAPVSLPGIVIVQHMPEKFTAAFAERLNRVCEIEVREAVDGDEIRPGLALIAPGNRHMSVVRRGRGFAAQVKDGPIVNHHRPSVDVLFRSVARVAGARAVGVILTGMGNDGAAGMKAMAEAGAYNIAQDEATSTVYGMPREAVKRGGVHQEAPLERIPAELARQAQLRRSGGRE